MLALQIDSRKVNTGHCFIAIKGSIVDGHLFIDTAIENGATSIICEQLPSNLKQNIIYVEVESCEVAVAYMSVNFYNNPSAKIKLIKIFHD